MKNVTLFDNGDQSVDKYTIILSNGDVYGASNFPFHPQGFGCFCFNIKDDLKQRTKKYIKDAKKFKNLGREVKDFSTLTEDLKKYIKQIF